MDSENCKFLLRKPTKKFKDDEKEEEIKNKVSNIIVDEIKLMKKISLRFKHKVENHHKNQFDNETFEHCKDESNISIHKKEELNESDDNIFGGLLNIKDELLQKIKTRKATVINKFIFR